MKYAPVSLAAAKEEKEMIAKRHRRNEERSASATRGGLFMTVASTWSRRDMPIPSIVEKGRMVAGKDSWAWQGKARWRWVNDEQGFNQEQETHR